MKRIIPWILCLWLVISGCNREPVETDLLLPLKFVSMPSDLVRTEAFPRDIEVHVRGGAGLIQQINLDNLVYPVDLYTDIAPDPAGSSVSIEPGNYTIPVLEDRIPLSPRVTITSVTPSFITVCLEQKISARLPVQVPYTGTPVAGHMALHALTDPEIIRLTGAASAIETLKTVETKPVDISGAGEDFKRKVPLNLPPFVESSMEDSIILVTVPIRAKIITRTFENIPVSKKGTGLHAGISPAVISITVKGPENILKKSGVMKEFRIYMDLEGLKPGVYVRRAVIALPMGVILTRADPEVFTITMEKR